MNSKQVRLFSSLGASQDAGHAAEADYVRYSLKNPGEPGGSGWSDWFPIGGTITPDNPASKFIKVQFRRSGRECMPFVYVVPRPGDCAEMTGEEGKASRIYAGPLVALAGTPIDDVGKLLLKEEGGGEPSSASKPTEEETGEPDSPSEPEVEADADAAKKAADEKDLRTTAVAAAAENNSKRRGPKGGATTPSKGRGLGTIQKEMDATLARMEVRNIDINATLLKLRDLNAEQLKDQKAMASLLGEASDAQRSTADFLANLL